ncbi:regulator of G-protein signaling 4 [Megalops cyprinoides]|uniref:regulator of G-protein signaling 4 n=1 Tax=Megalops cyprinoides TaxID=118141 RepID=UPI001864013A|nr:regulator of G-protein signaling 4 [Megalops cyprinoides]
MCKGLAVLPATCLKSAKDMKHRIGFLLQKPDLNPDQRAVHGKEKSTSVKRISQAEVNKWKDSLETLLNNDVGLTAFATFLKSEFSQENIEFWMACQEYKKITSQEKLASKARKIYDQYVAAESPNEVNLDSVTREETRKNLENPGPSCFEEAQRKIFLLMEKDSYKRFLKSKLFLDLVQQPTSNMPCGMEKRGRRNTSEFGQTLPQCA